MAADFAGVGQRPETAFEFGGESIANEPGEYVNRPSERSIGVIRQGCNQLVQHARFRKSDRGIERVSVSGRLNEGNFDR